MKPYLSIIIPTLNEEKHLQRTIEEVRNRASGFSEIEVIVIDSGSTDGTQELAEKMGVRCEKQSEFAGGKYKSLNHGAEKAKGDLLLFLDADSIVPQGFDQTIAATLRSNNTIAGAFDFYLDNRGLSYRIIEWLNKMRYRVDGFHFGDQGIFCTKKAFDIVGGFPPEPIMEAAFFCKKAKKHGKIKLVKQPMITSARRLETNGAWKVFFSDTWIYLHFLLGLNVRKFASNYWDENKKRMW